MTVIFFGIQGGIQSDVSGNVSFCVMNSDTNILLETSGSPISDLKKCNINPLLLDAMVISHSHIDHIYALPSIIHNLWLMKRDKDFSIIANSTTMSMIRRLLSMFNLFDKLGIFRINLIEPGSSEIKIGSLNLNFFRCDHSVETSGVSITSTERKIVYCADSAPLNAYPSFICDADGFIHEASGLKKNEKALNSNGHSSGHQAGEIGFNNNAKQLFLCHLPDIPGIRSEIIKEAEITFKNPVILPKLKTSYTL